MMTETNRVYHKSFGGLSYEILDEEAYERYWWGKRPSTREYFEAWLKDPDITQYSVSLEHGKSTSSISGHITEMVKQGIIQRFRRDDHERAQDRKVRKRRSKTEIFADILRFTEYGNTKTNIVYRTNLNFTIVRGYLSELIDRNLLEASDGTYTTTEMGFEFLKRYEDLKSFALLQK